MTKPQQSLAGQHERLEQETRVQDITVAISLPMSDAALIDVLGVFQNGTLTAAVTMRLES